MKLLNHFPQNKNFYEGMVLRDNLATIDIETMAADDAPQPMENGSVIEAADRFRTETNETLNQTKAKASKRLGLKAVSTLRESSGFRTKRVIGNWKRLWVSEAGFASLNPFEWAKIGLDSKGPILAAIKLNIDEIIKVYQESDLIYSKLTHSFLKETLFETIKTIASGGSKDNLSLLALDILDGAIDIVEPKIKEDFADFEKNILPTLGEEGSEKWRIFTRKWFGAGHDFRVNKQHNFRKNQFEDGIGDIRTISTSSREYRERKINDNILNDIDTYLDKLYIDGDTTGLSNFERFKMEIIQNPQDFLDNPNQNRYGFTMSVFNSTKPCTDPVLFLDTLYKHHHESVLSRQRIQRLFNDSKDVTANINLRIETIEALDGSFSFSEKILMKIESEKKPFPEGVDRHEFLSERLFNKLQSSPRAINVETEIFGKSIYLTPEEEVWLMLDYLAQNPSLYGIKMDGTTRQYVAEYYFKMHEELDETLVSGGISENASYIWRTRALDTADKVLEKSEEAIALLPNLNEKLTSLNGNEASSAIQTLRSVKEVFDIFKKRVGDGSTDDLMSKLPASEQEVLKTVFGLEELAKVLDAAIPKLEEERATFEEFLNVPNDITPYQEDRIRQQGILETVTEATQGGTGDGRGGINMSIGGSDSDGDGDGGGMETSASNLQQIIDKLFEKITGWQETLEQRNGFTFTLPPDISGTEGILIETVRDGIAQRRERLNIPDNIDWERPNFDTLMKLRLGEEISDAMKTDVERLVYNNTIQVWNEISKNANKGYVFSKLRYANTTHQTELAPVTAITNSILLDQEIRVVENRGDKIILETESQVIEIGKPTIGKNPHNMLIKEKTEEERGPLSENKPFSANFTHSVQKGILFSLSPENLSIENNQYYKNIWQNGTADSYFAQQVA